MAVHAKARAWQLFEGLGFDSLFRNTNTLLEVLKICRNAWDWHVELSLKIDALKPP